jgi:hypothetical protein
MSRVPFFFLPAHCYALRLAAVLAINRNHATIEQLQQCSHEFMHARSSTCPLRPPHNQQLPPPVPLQVHHRWHLPHTHHRLQVWRLPLSLLCQTAPPRRTPSQVQATEAQTLPTRSLVHSHVKKKETLDKEPSSEESLALCCYCWQASGCCLFCTKGEDAPTHGKHTLPRGRPQCAPRLYLQG